MLLALALAAALAVPTSSPSRTLRVGPGEPFSSPAAALAAARPGDTVRVAPGVYRGALTVDRRVVLLGAPGAVIEGEGRGSVVTVTADSAELRGFTLRNGGRSLDRDEAAVKLVRADGCRVTDNRIERSLHGVYLLESHGAEVSRNLVLGDPALAEARRGNGIHLFNSTGNTLAGNVVRGTRDGMYFSFASGNRVERNDVAGVRYGLHYMYSDDNLFRRNRFTRNAAGAAIMFSKRILFRENLFAEHVGYRAYGILLQTGEQIVAERNRIEGNLVGVFMDMSSANTFRENAITGNGIGIDMIASAEGNTFVANAVSGNRTAVRKPVGGLPNAWAEGDRGNYWGDREVFDLDGDGVGDRPYAVADPFASLAALRPVLEVFTGTPAALALSWAERALPVFDLPHVEDPHPLVSPPPGVPRARSTGEADDARTPPAALLLVLPATLAALGRARRLRKTNL